MHGLPRRERRRKQRRAIEAKARRQSAQATPGETRRRVAVLFNPGADGTVTFTIYRSGKLMLRQSLGLTEQFRLTMAWDTKRDVILGRLLFGPNADGSLLVGVMGPAGRKVITNATLPPAQADDMLTRVAAAAGTALGLALAPTDGRRPS